MKTAPRLHVPEFIREVLPDDFDFGFAREVGLAVLVLLLGALVAAIGRRRIERSSLHPQHRLLVARGMVLATYCLAIVWAMKLLGIEIGGLLGAAGVLTVAIGFAAQTSTSNLVSGLFLMAEQPFRIGDTVRIGDTIGEVVSIGLVSVWLRTPENLLVRIPNEAALKSNIINLSHHPIRRLDIKLGVSYNADIESVRACLLEIARAEPLCLEEPKPRVMQTGFGASSVDLTCALWTAKENYLDLRDAIGQEILRVFNQRGIEIPFPQTTLTAPASGLLVRLETPAGTAIEAER